MDKIVKNEMNAIIKKHKSVMFEFSNGKVYYLYKHHKHLDPEDAQRVYIGKSCPPITSDLRPSNRNPKSKILYIYKQL